MDKNFEVTEEDALRGEKEVEVEKRDGSKVKVKVCALPWRASIMALQAAVENPGLTAAYALEHCLPDQKPLDAFLNSIVPADAIWISKIALDLSNGVTAAKKMVAAKHQGPTS